MLDFNVYVARHGEFGVQALVERMERYEGIRSCVSISLEDRWNKLMQVETVEPSFALAA